MKRAYTVAVFLIVVLAAVGLAYATNQAGSTGTEDRCKGHIEKGQVKGCGTGTTPKEAETACYNNIDSFCEGVCTASGHGGGNGGGWCQSTQHDLPTGGYFIACECSDCICADGTKIPAKELT